MIRDLSETLNAILTQPGLPTELKAANIAFDHPVESFNPSTPTVNLFLFDIRENPDLRFQEASITPSNGAVVITQPPRRILCTYLVTAWVSGGTAPVWQEHRLLSQVLAVLSQYPTVPADLAVKTIKTSDPPVLLQVAMGNTATGASEFWSSLGAKLRPSLTVQATLALPVFPPSPPQPLARTSQVSTRTINPDGTTTQPESVFHITGRVTQSDGKPFPGATVRLLEAKLSTETDTSGAYWLGPLGPGQYTIQASAGSNSKQITCRVPAPRDANYDIQFSP
jgi:Pvc16 N-terminal domain/Carboxypeptidase regulatory-like domain